MKKLKLKLEVFIDNIEVDDSYYYIKYHYIIDGKNKKGYYENDYEGWTIKEWGLELEKGEAMSRVLQEIAEL